MKIFFEGTHKNKFEDDKKSKIDNFSKDRDWITPTGRLGRKDFLIRLIIIVLPTLFLVKFELYKIFDEIYYPIFIPPAYLITMQTIKRLHDIDRSGDTVSTLFSILMATSIWYISNILNETPLYEIIPILLLSAFFSSFILMPLFFKKGTEGRNRYGENPQKAEKEEIDENNG